MVLRQGETVEKSDSAAATVGPENASPTGTERRRILLFFPVFTHVFPRAFENFLRLVGAAVRLCPQYDFDPFVIERSSLVSAMNNAVDVAAKVGHNAIIAFDDDCLPGVYDFAATDPRHYQVIPRMLALLQHHPIVTGVGYMRGFPHTTTVGMEYPEGARLEINKDDGLTVKGFEWVDDIATLQQRQDPNGLVEVDFCGVPIIGIRRDVWEKVPMPLFETRDHLGRASTHDIYFCNKVRAHGFRVMVDTHIDCGHIIEAPIVNRDTKRDLLRVLGGSASKEEAHVPNR